MKKKKIRNIALIIIGIIVVGGAATGYYLYTKTTPDVAGITPEYTLTADELTQAFNSDEQKATKKYAGEVIEVSGQISEKTANDTSMTFILTGQKDTSSGVRCSFSPNALDQAKKYGVGDQVELKGKCTGKLFEVVLINCYPVND
jgi:hypothetical protein